VNRCYICQAEAVSRCYTCGQLICAEHGRDNCHRCDTGVVSGDPRPASISAQALRRRDAKHGWWRPQEAEEYEPPACYVCKGLARAVCRNCLSHYCREHAGCPGMCNACTRSARLGLIVFILAMAMIFGLIFLGAFVFNGR
jgi:hypothetical protein